MIGWVFALCTFFLVIGCLAFLVPTVSRKTPFLTSPCAWLWRRIVSFFLIWFSFWVVATIFFYQVRKYDVDDTDKVSEEMQATILAALVLAILWFIIASLACSCAEERIAKLLGYFEEFSWSLVFGGIFSSLVSTIHFTDRVADVSTVLVFFIIIVGFCLCLLCSGGVMKLLLTLQYVICIGFTITFSSIYMLRGESAWLSNDSVQFGIDCGVMFGITGLKLLYVVMHVCCCKSPEQRKKDEKKKNKNKKNNGGEEELETLTLSGRIIELSTWT
jgi:hypothetical protein